MYIYILSGSKGCYIGITDNLERRFKQHLTGNSSSSCQTKAGNNLNIEHWWNISNRYLALKIEQLLHKIQREEGNNTIWQIVHDVPISTKELLVEAMKLKDSSYQRQFRLPERSAEWPEKIVAISSS